MQDQEAHLQKIVLLKSKFRFANRSSFFGHAHFYADRVELEYWTWTGRKRRRLTLESVMDLEYRKQPDGANLSFLMESGKEYRLFVTDAHLWREYYENWISYQVLASAKFLEGPDQAASISG